jgi:CHAT domain-containing protein
MRSIKNLFVLFVSVMVVNCVPTLPGSGHSSKITGYFIDTNYHELVAYFEKTGGYPVYRKERDGGSSVTFYCSALYELRMLTKYSQCIEESYILDQKTIGRQKNQYDVEAIYRLRKATYFLAISQHKEAYSEARKAREAYANGKFKFDGGVNTEGIYGLAAAKVGKRREAEKSAEKILTIETQFHKMGKREIGDKLRKLNAMRVYSALNAYKKVVDTYSSGTHQEATSLNTVSSGPMAVYDFEMSIMYATALLGLDIYDDSKVLFETVLKHKLLNQYGGFHPFILQSRAKIAKNEKNMQAYESLLSSAIRLIENQRLSIATDEEKVGFAGDKQGIYLDLIQYYYQSGQFKKAYEYTERAKSRALVDVLASKIKFAKSSQQSTHLLTELNQLESQSLQLVSNQQRHSRSIKLVQNIETTDKQLSSLVSVKAPTLEDIYSKLNKNEVLVEYFGNDKHYFIFVLTKNSIKSVKIRSSNLEKLVTNYRIALSTRDSKKYKRASKALYNVVIKPVKHYIKGKRLTVVPHGSLHYVPFASLWDGRRYLVQKYQIRTLPSASVLEFLKDKVTNKAGSLLILGNPDLGDPQYDLPAAQEESLKLAKRIKGSKVLLRAKATETALKKYGSSFKSIHFAMHGIFEAEKPLTSGLLMSPDSENDGRLTVLELYDLDLNADLVTLSACETALGETKSGDDVIGFTRGFLYAGANSIVSSLWEVDDDATRDLMLRFYRELKSNNKARALQKAQLRVMKKYPHPYYWAAFQLTGQY